MRVHAVVAQLEAHVLWEHGAVGSSPANGTKRFPGNREGMSAIIVCQGREAVADKNLRERW